jgi:hypothetical protein
LVERPGIGAPPHAEDPLKHLHDIDGLDELEISGYLTDNGLERVRGLRHLRRLKLSGAWPVDALKKGKQAAGSGLAALHSCPALRELIIENCELPAAGLGQIETLSRLEKLTMSGITCSHPVVFHINTLAALRELELSDWHGPGADGLKDNSILTVGGLEAIQRLSQLEKFILSFSSVGSSDIRFLCNLPALRELDLTGCANLGDDAVPYLQKMAGLRG